MKTTRNALFALLLLGATAGAASAQLSVGAGVNVGSGGHASVDLGFFYDNLAQYGNWIQRPSHGWVWTPRDVAASWRPYQAGHWVWSDQGWTWLTDEPYGWATYHYGRWYQDPEIGWAWVPGNDWAPAWVSWQEGKDYVGWAPLPPGANVTNASYNSAPAGPNGGGYDNGPAYDNNQAYDNNPPYDNQGYDNPPYDDNAGYDNGPVYDNGPGYNSAPVYGGGYGYDSGYGYGRYGYANYAYGIAPEAYLFVPTRSFLSIDLFDFFVPWVRVSSFWGFTRNCTDYGFYGGRYFNRGIPFEHVHRFYGNVPRYRLSELGGFRGRGYQVDGNRLAFFRPQVNRGWRGSPLDRPGARRSVVTASQFRNDHPDRQRVFAQTNRQNFGRNDGRMMAAIISGTTVRASRPVRPRASAAASSGRTASAARSRSTASASRGSTASSSSTPSSTVSSSSIASRGSTASNSSISSSTVSSSSSTASPSSIGSNSSSTASRSLSSSGSSTAATAAGVRPIVASPTGARATVVRTIVATAAIAGSTAARNLSTRS